MKNIVTPEQRLIQLEAEIAGLRVQRDGAVADLRGAERKVRKWQREARYWRSLTHDSLGGEKP